MSEMKKINEEVLSSLLKVLFNAEKLRTTLKSEPFDLLKNYLEYGDELHDTLNKALNESGDLETLREHLPFINQQVDQLQLVANSPLEEIHLSQLNSLLEELHQSITELDNKLSHE